VAHTPSCLRVGLYACILLYLHGVVLRKEFLACVWAKFRFNVCLYFIVSAWCSCTQKRLPRLRLGQVPEQNDWMQKRSGMKTTMPYWKRLVQERRSWSWWGSITWWCIWGWIIIIIDTVPVGLSHERRGLWHFSKLTSWTNISRVKNTYKRLLVFVHLPLHTWDQFFKKRYIQAKYIACAMPVCSVFL
jgi:hypothetical protein